MEITVLIHSTLDKFIAIARALEAEGKALMNECVAARKLSEDDALEDIANRRAVFGALDKAIEIVDGVRRFTESSFDCLYGVLGYICTWPRADIDPWLLKFPWAPISDAIYMICSVGVWYNSELDLADRTSLMAKARDQIWEAFDVYSSPPHQVAFLTIATLIDRAFYHLAGVSGFVRGSHSATFAVLAKYSEFICTCSGLIPELTDEVMEFMMGCGITKMLRKEHPLHTRRE